MPQLLTVTIDKKSYIASYNKEKGYKKDLVMLKFNAKH